MLRRPVGLSRVEAAIDRAWLLRTALISFGRRGNDIVAHLLPKHPRLPAKRVPVELRHALAVVVGHFEVYDRVHFAHGCPPCRLIDTTMQGALTSICSHAAALHPAISLGLGSGRPNAGPKPSSVTICLMRRLQRAMASLT